MRCPRCRTWRLFANSCEPCQEIALLKAELRIARKAMDEMGAMYIEASGALMASKAIEIIVGGEWAGMSPREQSAAIDRAIGADKPEPEHN